MDAPVQESVDRLAIDTGMDAAYLTVTRAERDISTIGSEGEEYSAHHVEREGAPWAGSAADGGVEENHS